MIMNKTVYLYVTRIDARGSKSDPEFLRNVNVAPAIHETVRCGHRVDTATIANVTDTPTERYHLRTTKLIPITDRERASLQREYDRLKREGKLPSAFDLIAGKLSRK